MQLIIIRVGFFRFAYLAQNLSFCKYIILYLVVRHGRKPALAQPDDATRPTPLAF